MIEPDQLDNGIYLSYSSASFFSCGGSHNAVHPVLRSSAGRGSPASWIFGLEPGQLDSGIYLSYSKAPNFSCGGSHNTVHPIPILQPGVGARPVRYS